VGLFLDILKKAIPVRLELQSRIEHGGRVARHNQVANTVRLGQCIGAVQRRLVTVNAAPSAVDRNPRVEKQHATQIRALGRDGKIVRCRVLGKWLEVL